MLVWRSSPVDTNQQVTQRNAEVVAPFENSECFQYVIRSCKQRIDSFYSFISVEQTQLYASNSSKQLTGKKIEDNECG